MLASQQLPCKIGLTGTDGRIYSFLIKTGRTNQNEDLRKDSRLMDLTSFLNNLFEKCLDSRRRHLYSRVFVRTYSYILSGYTDMGFLF